MAWVGNGRPPIYCDQCVAANHRRRREAKADAHANRAAIKAEDVATMVATEQQAVAEHRAGLDALEEAAYEQSLAERLAIGLGIDPDAQSAAKLAGVRYKNKRQLAKLTGIAKKKHADLIMLKPAAVGGLIHAAIALAALDVRCAHNKIPASSLPLAMSSLVKSYEALTGGLTPAYSTIELIIQAPGGPTT